MDKRLEEEKAEQLLREALAGREFVEQVGRQVAQLRVTFDQIREMLDKLSTQHGNTRSRVGHLDRRVDDLTHEGRSLAHRIVALEIRPKPEAPVVYADGPTLVDIMALALCAASLVFIGAGLHAKGWWFW